MILNKHLKKMLKNCLFSCLALIALSYSFAESKSTLVDRDGADIESIAQVVCDVKKGTSKQIGSGSTVEKLAGFFSGLPPDHKLAACGAKYGSSLDRLAKVLASNNEDVCAELKLQAIEQFHRDYVSRLPKHIEDRKQRKLAIPKVVKLFFLHYATEVSSICARDALKQLETLKFNSGDDSPDALEVDSALRRFQDYMGTSQLELGYSEVFLPWLLIDGLPLEKYSKAGGFIVPHGDKKLFIKSKDSDKLLKIQAMCSFLLKPIYDRVLLPVVRLISLGYYPKTQELAQQLASESPLKRLYLSTQLCESILPIQVFDDPTLAEDQIILLSPEDAADMKDAKTIPSNSIDVTEIGLTEPQNSMPMFEVSETSSIGVIKNNVVARGKALGRVFSLLIRAVKGKLKSKLKKVILKRGNKQEELSPEEEETVLPPEDFSRELAKDYQLDNDEDDDQQQQQLVRRRKRASIEPFLNFIGAVFELCFNVIYFILNVIFSLIRFFVVGALIILYKIFRMITGFAVGDIETALEWLWNAGKEYKYQNFDLTYNYFDTNRKVTYIGPRKRRIYGVELRELRRKHKI